MKTRAAILLSTFVALICAAPIATDAQIIGGSVIDATGGVKGKPKKDGESDWNNSGTNWNTGASWTIVSGSAPPVPGDVAWFKIAAGTQPNLSASVSIAGLYFNGPGTFGYNVTSSSSSISLTLTGTAAAIGSEISDSTAVAIGAENTSGTNTISAPIVLGAVANSTQTIYQEGGGTLVISGPISSINANVGITKTGTGVLTLSGANTYAGGTTINGGTLLVNNVSGSGVGSGAVTVNNTGTLGGNGIISGSVVVNNGGKLSPGSSTGILHTGALTFNSGSTYVVDVNGGAGPSGLGAGTLYDQVISTGLITIGGNLSLTLGNTPLAIGDKLYILGYTGAPNESGVFANTTNGGLTYTQGDDVFSILYNDPTIGNGMLGVSLTVTAIPEPATWLGAALATIAVAFTSRRCFRSIRL